MSDPRVNENNGKEIKIYGWLVNENQEITIIGDSLYASGQTERGYWGIPIACSPEIQTAIDTLDLTRKCYLKGELKLEKIQDGKGMWCCKVGVTRILLKSLNDMYFE